MTKPHKWANEIKAWADGAEIEYKYSPAVAVWTINYSPSWNEDYFYRIKPQPKEKTYLYVCVNKDGEFDFSLLKDLIDASSSHTYIGKIEIQND